MPINTYFSAKILIAGVPVPEYEKDGNHYVECCLSTPVSYKTKSTTVSNGEQEAQEWPVTPYSILVAAHPQSSVQDRQYFKVLVDGVKIKGLSLAPGESKIVRGFKDGSVLRELLFSLPRFPENETDRLPDEKVPSVGKIVIECWDAELRTTRRALRHCKLDFEQANKKDCASVTGGNYTMATSKPGKILTSRSLMRTVDHWHCVRCRDRIVINYRMAHTLQEMGFDLKAIEIPQSVLSKIPPTADTAEASVIDLTNDDNHNGSQQQLVEDIKEEIVVPSADDVDETAKETGTNIGDDDDDVLIVSSTAHKEPAVTEEIDIATYEDKEAGENHHSESEVEMETETTAAVAETNEVEAVSELQEEGEREREEPESEVQKTMAAECEESQEVHVPEEDNEETSAMESEAPPHLGSGDSAPGSDSQGVSEGLPEKSTDPDSAGDCGDQQESTETQAAADEGEDGATENAD